MKSQFKLAAVALALVSSSSAFAADLDSAAILIATPIVTDLDSASALYDTGGNANDYTKSNAIITQVGDLNVAVIDQTGPNLALIAQSGATAPGVAYIVQVSTSTGNSAAIVQR